MRLQTRADVGHRAGRGSVRGDDRGRSVSGRSRADPGRLGDARAGDVGESGVAHRSKGQPDRRLQSDHGARPQLSDARHGDAGASRAKASRVNRPDRRGLGGRRHHRRHHRRRERRADRRPDRRRRHDGGDRRQGRHAAGRHDPPRAGWTRRRRSAERSVANLDGSASDCRPTASHRLAGRFDRRCDVALGVRRRQEPRLELRRRRIDAALEHRLEEAAVGPRCRPSAPTGSRRRPAREKRRQHRSERVHLQRHARVSRGVREPGRQHRAELRQVAVELRRQLLRATTSPPSSPAGCPTACPPGRRGPPARRAP